MTDLKNPEVPEEVQRRVEELSKAEAESMLDDIIEAAPLAVVQNNSSSLLSRELILNAQDVPFDYVEVPEWGGRLKVRGMTGEQRDEWETSFTSQDEDGNVLVNIHKMRAKMVALAAVDENNVRLFTEEDISALNKKSAAVLERIFNVGARLSGLSKDEVDKLGKGSKMILAGGSDTD